MMIWTRPKKVHRLRPCKISNNRKSSPHFPTATVQSPVIRHKINSSWSGHDEEKNIHRENRNPVPLHHAAKSNEPNPTHRIFQSNNFPYTAKIRKRLNGIHHNKRHSRIFRTNLRTVTGDHPIPIQRLEKTNETVRPTVPTSRFKFTHKERQRTPKKLPIRKSYIQYRRTPTPT